MILGQDQDEIGGGFNTEEAVIGDVSQLNLWSRVLSDNDIHNLAWSCGTFTGDVANWADFSDDFIGIYFKSTKSYACDCKYVHMSR